MIYLGELFEDYLGWCVGKSLSQVPSLKERSEHELFPGDGVTCRSTTANVLLPLLPFGVRREREKGNETISCNSSQSCLLMCKQLVH